MDRRELLDKTARSEEERLLLSRVWDKREQCRLRNIPTATAFLSPQEQAAATRLLNALGDREGYALWGGYEGAERRRLLFLPDWMAEPDDSAVAALRAVCRSGASLTHRDFLGSLMALGLTREKIGDILVESGGCQVLVDPLSLDFLTQSWDSAGRERLTVTPLPLEELTVPQAAVKEVRDTVSSLRLDAVLSAMLHVSRGTAAELIEAGRVEINHLPVEKPHAPVYEQDVFTVRGKGRFRLTALPGKSKKDRSIIEFFQY